MMVFTSQLESVSVCVVVNLGENHLQAAQTDKEAAVKVVKEVFTVDYRCRF